MSRWINDVFEAKIVKKGGIVRRKKSSVHHYASRDELIEQVEERGFHLLEIGNQYVVICDKGKMEVIR